MERSIDTWIQRGSTAAMVALAAVLIAVGITLYAPLTKDLGATRPAPTTDLETTTQVALTNPVGTTHARP